MDGTGCDIGNVFFALVFEFDVRVFFATAVVKDFESNVTRGLRVKMADGGIFNANVTKQAFRIGIGI